MVEKSAFESGIQSQQERVLRSKNFPIHNYLTNNYPNLMLRIKELIVENAVQKEKKQMLDNGQKQELKEIIAHDPEFKKMLEDYVKTKFFFYFYKKISTFRAEVMKAAQFNPEETAKRIKNLYNKTLEKAYQEDLGEEFRLIDEEYQRLARTELFSELPDATIEKAINTITQAQDYSETNYIEKIGAVAGEIPEGSMPFTDISDDERASLPQFTTDEIALLLGGLQEQGNPKTVLK